MTLCATYYIIRLIKIRYIQVVIKSRQTRLMALPPSCPWRQRTGTLRAKPSALPCVPGRDFHLLVFCGSSSLLLRRRDCTILGHLGRCRWLTLPTVALQRKGRLACRWAPFCPCWPKRALHRPVCALAKSNSFGRTVCPLLRCTMVGFEIFLTPQCYPAIILNVQSPFLTPKCMYNVPHFIILIKSFLVEQKNFTLVFYS